MTGGLIWTRVAAFKTALDARAMEDPKAREARPEDFYDDRSVEELEQKGVIKALYGR